MAAPIIYMANPYTGEFVGTGYADPDPLEPGRWLIPAHAYMEAPPEPVTHQVVVRLGDGWALIPDYRGMVYWTTDGERHEITEAGIEPPAGALDEPPPPPPPTREDIERLRRMAYADSLIGSDRLFAEASRMQMMGEPGWQDIRDKGVARFREIRAQYPWP